MVNKTILLLGLLFCLSSCAVLKPSPGDRPHLPSDCCGQVDRQTPQPQIVFQTSRHGIFTHS